MIYVNGTAVKPTLFPDGTSQMWHLPEELLKQYFVTVHWVLDTEAEFMHLAQLKMLLDSNSIVAVLELPYLPYARQDKSIQNDATFAFIPFLKMLNALDFHRVIVLDPHNIELAKKIRNVELRSPKERILKLCKDLEVHALVYPDGGALDRYCGDLWNATKGIVVANKQRDPSSGHITGMEITQFAGPGEGSYLIVDDICDGGATFVMLAELLKKNSAREINLFVTHGIFSKGLRALKAAGINRIFTHEGEAYESFNTVQIKEFRDGL